MYKSECTVSSVARVIETCHNKLSKTNTNNLPPSGSHTLSCGCPIPPSNHRVSYRRHFLSSTMLHPLSNHYISYNRLISLADAPSPRPITEFLTVAIISHPWCSTHYISYSRQLGPDIQYAPPTPTSGTAHHLFDTPWSQPTSSTLENMTIVLRHPHAYSESHLFWSRLC